MDKIWLDELWDRARAWAARRGLLPGETTPPLWGYVVAYWFSTLGIKYVGIINLDMDADGEWFATYQIPECAA